MATEAHRPRLKPHAVSAIGLVVLTIAAVAVAVVLDVQEAPRAERTTPLTGPTTVERAEGTRENVLFIGDSYTAGQGADSRSDRWSSIVASEMRWREINWGRGGTGYISTSSNRGCGRDFCAAYGERIKETAHIDVDVVIVAGGQNDFRTFRRNPAEVERAIAEAYETIDRVHPNARIVAVGPSTPAEVDDIVIDMDAAVQDAARSVRGDYISLIQPGVIQPGMVLGDGGHVGPDGHSAIADRVISGLR